MAAMVHSMTLTPGDVTMAPHAVAADLPLSLAAQSLVTPAAPTLLTLLRAGTRAAHDRMETAPALACLMSPGLTAPGYVFALQALHALQAGVAARFAALPAGEPAIRAPDDGALRLLAEDLAWFGARPRRRLALQGAIPDRLAAIGALYVVEGSALGARVIGRAVSQSIGVAPGRGGSFFCSATAEAARSRWLAVAGFLTASGTKLDEDGQARVVAGARAVFDALARALRAPRRAPAPAPGSDAKPPLSAPAASGRALT
jgi:heme oxygenase